MSTRAFATWVNQLCAGHPELEPIGPYVDTAANCVRAGFRNKRTDRLAAVAFDISALYLTNVEPIWTELNEAALRALVVPPRDGGAFTQDDAIKLSGVRDVSRRRVRRS